MEMMAIAQGIETAEQLGFLRGQGCGQNEGTTQPQARCQRSWRRAALTLQ
ncbi:hypothetical protein ACFFTM_01890 [Pseudoduganella plicata]|uniref:EAL domain-containing protein n=2 Tax=Pseudoduganella plicata TaxID=321984 RepID=A0AA88C6A5_9BURK|nr:hypothetical protein GCM10007388_01230 [Pseudoduganella plicata]